MRFGPQSVFMDVSGIEPGRDFRKAIDQSVTTCSVLLAMIGREWLESKDSRGNRRLDDPNDFVRMELASALQRDIPVVPVLVRGAKMPHAEQLPDDLKELAYRNAVELTHARWKSDVQLLLHALRPYLNVDDGEASIEHSLEPQEAPNGKAKEASRTQAVASGSSPAEVVSKVDPETIQRASNELAVYIGPISEVVAKRAARRCSSVEDFYQIMMQEIEGETDRAKFRRSCRS